MHFGLFALDKRKISQEKDKPEKSEPTESTEEWGGALELGSMERCIGLSRNGLSPKPVDGGEGTCFVNWFGIGNGVSFS